MKKSKTVKVKGWCVLSKDVGIILRSIGGSLLIYGHKVDHYDNSICKPCTITYEMSKKR